MLQHSFLIFHGQWKYFSWSSRRSQSQGMVLFLLQLRIIHSRIKDVRRQITPFSTWRLLTQLACWNSRTSRWCLYFLFSTSTHGTLSCKVVAVVGYTLDGVSLSSLVVLSIDRLIAIKTPLQYACRVSKKKVRNASMQIWFYFIFVGIGPLVY